MPSDRLRGLHCRRCRLILSEDDDHWCLEHPELLQSQAVLAFGEQGAVKTNAKFGRRRHRT